MALNLTQLDRKYMPEKGILSWTKEHVTFLRQLYEESMKNAQDLSAMKEIKRGRAKRNALVKRQSEIAACIIRLEIARRVVKNVSGQSGVGKRLPTWAGLEDHVVKAENALPDKEMPYVQAVERVIQTAVRSVVGRTSN